MTILKTGELGPSLRKAAILVYSLDRDSADALLDKMGNDQAARVRSAITDLGDVSPQEQQEVLAEFLRAKGPLATDVHAGVELADSLTQKLRGGAAFEHETHPRGVRTSEPHAFQFLQEADPDALARYLQREHPQTIAVVVAHLPPQRAAALVQRLPDRMQAQVLSRVAAMDDADPEILRDVAQQLADVFSDDIRAARNRIARVSAVASILEAAGKGQAELVKHVSRHDRQLMSLLSASALGKQSGEEHSVGRGKVGDSQRPSPPNPLASGPLREPSPPALPRETSTRQAPAVPLAGPASVEFNDLERIDDRGLAALFRAADPQVALLALAGASEEFVQRILKHLPKRDARSLRQQMERLGPLRLADVEQAQRRIGQLATELAAQDALPFPKTARFAAVA